jgi:hypothetical protein
MQQKSIKEPVLVFLHRARTSKTKGKNLSTMLSCQESGGEGSQVIPLKLGI